MGTDERTRIRNERLEKERKHLLIKQNVALRKQKELKDKTIIEVNYDFNKDVESAAFEKLSAAAKLVSTKHVLTLLLTNVPT